MTSSGESQSENLHGTTLSEARSEEDLVLVDAGGVGFSCFLVEALLKVLRNTAATSQTLHAPGLSQVPSPMRKRTFTRLFSQLNVAVYQCAVLQQAYHWIDFMRSLRQALRIACRSWALICLARYDASVTFSR